MAFACKTRAAGVRPGPLQRVSDERHLLLFSLFSCPLSLLRGESSSLAAKSSTLFNLNCCCVPSGDEQVAPSGHIAAFMEETDACGG